MSRVIVDVTGRKKRTDYKKSSGGVLETVKRERQEKNKKMLSEYNREIKKVVHSR
jgi:hypothetical protein